MIDAMTRFTLTLYAMFGFREVMEGWRFERNERNELLSHF